MLGNASRLGSAVNLVASLFYFCTLVSAASWTSTATLTGNDFYSAFDWFTAHDPTNGQVAYQSLGDAQNQQLSYVNSAGSFVMAVSTVPTVSSLRNSVRISSKTAYSDGVYVLNVTHVPTGCAVWPAFWTVTQDLGSWPAGGEIDIMESANDQYKDNLVSLHTKSGCTIPSSIASQSGTVQNTNCSAYADGNAGCGTLTDHTSNPTWGSAMNSAGGGVIAMERAFGTGGEGIRTWYFPNSAPDSLPSDLRWGSSVVNPDGWGTPNAHFPVSSCYADFGPHSITFDITLCGDWAGNTYGAAGCTSQFSSCSDQVLNHGASFSQVYWEVDSIRLFTQGGSEANAANSPQ